MKPPFNQFGKAWKITTESTAIARSPSMSGRYLGCWGVVDNSGLACSARDVTFAFAPFCNSVPSKGAPYPTCTQSDTEEAMASRPQELTEAKKMVSESVSIYSARASAPVFEIQNARCDALGVGGWCKPVSGLDTTICKIPRHEYALHQWLVDIQPGATKGWMHRSACPAEMRGTTLG